MEHNENIQNMNLPFSEVVHFTANEIRRRKTWPEDREARLCELWAEGHSAAATAEKLNNEFGVSLTRNAIIGKVARANLPKRKTHIYAVAYRAPRKYYPSKNPRKPKIWELFGPIIDDAAIPADQRKTLLQLERGDCRWPIGDPLEQDFFFCGAPQHDGSSYCLGHTVRSIRHD